MKNIGVIDIGGTTIKFAVWQGNELVACLAKPTPNNLPDFYELLTTQVNQMKQTYPLSGVAISSPGAVNQKTGVIEGASALPYIHNFEIQSVLAAKFGLPVSIENDANCAALAELDSGAGQQAASLVFLIIGTGVGGSIIINHQVWHGAHLFGGEFGYALSNDRETVSQLGTAVSVAKCYEVATGHQLSGKQVFELAEQGDGDAKAAVQVMCQALAKAIYNIQYSFDPERIILGGAISNNPQLIPMLNQAIAAIRQRVEIASIKPEIVSCAYHDQANLRGAVVDFNQMYPTL